ncbi:MAG: nucleotide sugar dehydrogenase [Pseudomonadota bacterium]
MHVSIFGLGYVGATSLACLAELGHQVTGVDVNPQKAQMINQGLSPVFEPGLRELIQKHLALGNLSATAEPTAALALSEAVLVCVGTPSTRHGLVDDRALRRVITDIARYRQASGRVIPILVRSTALPPLHRGLLELLRQELGPDQPLAYCVHPEFLRAGSGVRDFMEPPKVIFGPSDEAAAAACRTLYPGFSQDLVFTDPLTASMAKYADNCFHAVKVTFANEMGLVCKALGIDARQVMDIFCLDHKLNLSAYYMKPGFAFGGSCLPKDLKAVVQWGRSNMVALPMLEHVLPSNALQVSQFLARVLETGARRVGIFGLAFKENTDDLRESPLVALAESLAGKGKSLAIYDPNLAMSRMVGTNLSFALAALPHLAEVLVDDPARLVADSQVVIISRDFPGLDWAGLPWRAEQTVFHLAHAGQPAGAGGRGEGLYW